MSGLRPLRKKNVEGVLYKRRVQTEELIYICQELTFDELCDRAEIKTRNHTNYIPSEVLVYFLRETKTHETDVQFGRLYKLLEMRIKRVCPQSEVRFGEKVGADAHLLELQEFVIDHFTERVMLDRQVYEEKLDVYEYAFEKAVAHRKLDAMRKMYRNDKPKEPLAYDEYGDIPANEESVLVELFPRIDEVIYRFQLQQAIDTLPEDERRVINMILAGIPSESTNSNVETISTLLNCGPQTVRNRRDRAVKKLQIIIGTEIKNAN